MRLPEPEEVKTEGARLLYAHDVVEYHCGDARNFYAQMYKSRLGLLLHLAKGAASSAPTQQSARGGRVLDLG